MASSSHSSHFSKNHAYIYANVRNVRDVHHNGDDVMHHNDVYASHAMIASSSSSNAHGRSRSNVSHMLKARNASYVLYCKSGRVVAANVRLKCKNGKSCIWVPK
jgi:hypothetical protein